MIYLPDVTLICVSSVKLDQTLYAFRKSMQGISFGDVKLVTHEESIPGYAESGIALERCHQINSIDSYSAYMMYELHKHVNTSHCITIQADGFIINPDKWDPLWLEYDYIGAVWPHYDQYNVGCGGMSLRSRKLLQATSKITDDQTDYDIPEDLMICRYYRAFLEQGFAIRYAPPAVANHFSQEMMAQPWSTFSFHGPAFLPRLYANQIEFLFENLSPQNEIKMIALERACAKVGPRAIRALEAFRLRTDADRERDA